MFTSKKATLRLWCTAAMAPALTDAAAHPRSCKLPASPMNPENNNSLRANPGSPSDPGIGLGSGGEILSRTLELDTASQIIKGATTLETINRVVNGNGKQKHIVSDKISFNGKNGGSKLILTNGNSHHHTLLEQISIDLTPLSKTNTNLTSSVTGTSMLKKIDLPTRLNGHSNGNTATMPPETTTTTLGRLRGTKKEDNIGELERNEDISTIDTRILDIDVENTDTESLHAEDSRNIPNITGELVEPIEILCDTSEEKEMKVNTKRTDSLKRQKKLEHQAIVIMKRIRRIQSHQLSSHVKKQIGDAVDHEYKLRELLKEPIQDEISERLLEDKTLDVSPTDTKVNSRFLPGSGGSLGRTSYEGSPHITEEFLKAKTSDMQVVIGNLNANLRHLENAIDSDATESSSGGETDDEDDASKLPLKLHKVPLHKRSLWRWAKARSAIASRWTWLQAQVSDLEYRIRQQNDIHRQIRSTKGAVTLGEPPSAEEILRIKTVNSSYRPGKKLSPIDAKIARLEGKNELSPSNISMLLCNVDRQSAKLQKSFQNCGSPISGSPTSHRHATNGSDKVHPSCTTVNGVVDGTKTHIDTPNNQHKRIRLETSTPSPTSFSLQVPIEEKYCARTRPVKYYRKRRIVKSNGMHYLSRKAAKRSTVKCRCCQPQMPCVMCGGRYNNLKPLDTNFTPEKERLSLLDYSYHPVLSFKKDVPATVRLENLISNGDWQRRSSSKAQSRKKSRLSSRDKKAKRKLSKSSSYLFASKLRELKQLKKESKMLSRSHSQPMATRGSLDLSRQCRMDMKNKRAAQLAIAALKKRARSLSLPEINCKTSSGASTPTTDGQGLNALLNSMPAHALNMMRRKGIANDAYDIDNIVIPYSILSSTRVEKLNYKEIVTPKWRLVIDEQVLKRNILLQKTAEDQPDEDDQQNIEAIQLRHSKSEVLEKSLYITALTDHSHSNVRRGHSRRSRTNSATTPDPNPSSPDFNMSETQMSDSLNASSSAMSLPESATVTPSPSPLTIHDTSVLERNPERRRISNNSESTVEFEEEFLMVDPWPLRTFPLTEEEMKDLETEVPIFHQEPDVCKSSASSTPKSSVAVSRSESPRSDMSSEPEEDINEDPNDPEWTVVLKQKKVEVTPKGSIVLKLARR